MEEKLTTEEQAILEWVASEGQPVHVRRACLLLLCDQGLAPKEIGPQVGLSVGRVRYWLRAFGERRVDVFPAELLAAAPAEPPPMEGLTAEERAKLEWIASEGKPVHVRRARLLLLRDHGLAAKEIGPQVGLAVRTVRYWLRAFRARRMDVLPADLLAAAPSSLPPIGADEGGEAERPEITVEELCQRYEVDMAHARHVADLALALFDVTAEAHGLLPERRDLLETAAILHNVGFAFYPEKHHTAGRNIILEHRLVELGQVEQQMVACTTAFHRKRFKPKRLDKEPSFLALPADVRDETLALAALLRVADGLDYSQSQMTFLGEAESSPQAIVLPVLGPFAEGDAARARQKADLWNHLFDVELQFIMREELVLASEPEEAEPEIELLPRPKRPGVLPDDPMSEAGRKVLRFHLVRMLDHEPGTRLGEDIEELHDMRVATRRMRSAFRVFAPYFERDGLRPFLKGLRRTGRALGSVRDLDVIVEKAWRYVGELPEDEKSDLDPLLEDWRGRREAAREKMLAHLDSKRYQRFVQEFGQFLATEGAGALRSPAGKPAPQRVYQALPALIYARYQVVRGYEPVIENAPLETLHALRIDCKRFRYALEFFREVLGPEAEDVIKELVIVQDHLGDLHDADVACCLLVEFLDQWSRQERRERINISGVTRYLVAKQNELRVLVDSFPGTWQHFNSPEMRRQLALAVSVL
ncbi:MAG: CHAD domain-containing protein [Chloroflexi bacterium]|nr:CHAD domain-containing protein [Chloroflexota bacterium]